MVTGHHLIRLLLQAQSWFLCVAFYVLRVLLLFALNFVWGLGVASTLLALSRKFFIPSTLAQNKMKKSWDCFWPGEPCTQKGRILKCFNLKKKKNSPRVSFSLQFWHWGLVFWRLTLLIVAWLSFWQFSSSMWQLLISWRVPVLSRQPHAHWVEEVKSPTSQCQKQRMFS